MEELPNDINSNNISNPTPEGITEITIDGIKLEIDIKEIYSMLENTIQKNFNQNDYSNLTSIKNLLSDFFTNEKECLLKIESYEKIKKKLYKSIIYESIMEIFKQCSEKLVTTIFGELENIRKIINKKGINLDEFYKILEQKLLTKDIPKFLVRNDIKFIKFKESLRKKEKTMVKNIIEYYKKLLDGNSIPFDLFRDKKILFNIFVLSNAKDIGSNKIIEELFFINFDEIRTWFGLSKDLENYQNILTDFIDISEVEQQSLLESFLSQLNLELNKLNNKDDKLFLILISSFFYCIMHRMNDLQKNNNKINDANSKITIFLKNIFESFNKYIKFENYNFKSIINSLFEYAYSNNQNENRINDNNSSSNNNNNSINIFLQEENIDFDFFLMEEIINHSNDNNLKERFQQIKSKFKVDSIETSKSLFGSMFQKVTNLLTSNNYYYTNYISLSAFQKYKTSNVITILVSGFGSENDRFYVSWEKYIENDPTNSTYYFFQWPSDSLIKIIAKSVPISIGQLSNLPKIFTESKIKAAYSGKLLSIILLSRKFFGNQRINLVGFSLGCHVIKHCIKELSNSNDGKNIINNVIFLGGATSFKNKLKWYNNLNKIVKGRIINCHSNEDEILKKLFKGFTGKNPIGKDKIDINDGKGGKNIIENYDFTDIKLGHLEYRKYLNLILKRIYEE